MATNNILPALRVEIVEARVAEGGVNMLKVYGCSDDLVEIEGAEYPNDEIGCFNRDVKIKFRDGTEIKVGYPKHNLAVWWIEVLKHGSGTYILDYCHNEDAEIYSDILTIDSELLSVEVVPKEE